MADDRALPADDELRTLPGVTDVRHEDDSVSLATSEVHRAVPALLDALRDTQRGI